NVDSGLTVSNNIISDGPIGIYNNGSNGTDILANQITNVDGSGIFVNPSFNIDVIGNIISGANEGVKLDGNTNINIVSNTITDINTDGVQVFNHNGVLNISSNAIAADDHGIYHGDNITGGDDVDIHDNTIIANMDNGVIGSGIFFDGTITGG